MGSLRSESFIPDVKAYKDQAAATPDISRHPRLPGAQKGVMQQPQQFPIQNTTVPLTTANRQQADASVASGIWVSSPDSDRACVSMGWGHV